MMELLDPTDDQLQRSVSGNLMAYFQYTIIPCRITLENDGVLDWGLGRLLGLVVLGLGKNGALAFSIVFLS